MNDDITQKDDPITAATPGAKQGKPGSAFEVLLAFFKLGVTCFGGPIAHIGYFREEFVVRRHWLDEQTWRDRVREAARSLLRRRENTLTRSPSRRVTPRRPARCTARQVASD